MEYETDIMTFENINRFINWADEHIGTDNEINACGEGLYYAVIFDLSEEEVKRLGNKEFNMSVKPLAL